MKTRLTLIIVFDDVPEWWSDYVGVGVPVNIPGLIDAHESNGVIIGVEIS